MNATLPSAVDQAGCSSISTKYVSGLDVLANGVITITMTGMNGGNDPDGQTLSLTPTTTGAGATFGITEWSCSTSASKKYVPAQCRG